MANLRCHCNRYRRQRKVVRMAEIRQLQCYVTLDVDRRLAEISRDNRQFDTNNRLALWIYRCEGHADDPNWEDDDNYRLERIAMKNYRWDKCMLHLDFCEKKNQEQKQNFYKFMFNSSRQFRLNEAKLTSISPVEVFAYAVPYLQCISIHRTPIVLSVVLHNVRVSDTFRYLSFLGHLRVASSLRVLPVWLSIRPDFQPIMRSLRTDDVECCP